MRVDELAEKLGDRVEINWHSFLLRTEPKTSSLEKFVEYTKSWARPAATEPQAKFTTPWASGAEPPTSSIPAQIAWKVSAAFGNDMQAKYHHALLEAYFTDNRNISDSTVLLDIAAECGMDRDEFGDAFATRGQELAQEVISEHNSAIENEITAVPTVVIEGILPVPGAQDVETYERLIERVLAKRGG